MLRPYTSSKRPSLDSVRDSVMETSLPVRHRIPTIKVRQQAELEKQELREPAQYDWSQLNTPAQNSRRRKPRPAEQIIQESEEQLEKLSNIACQTSNLDLLVAGTRAILSQKWETLLIYFDKDTFCPRFDRPWSHTVWRRCDVIEHFTALAISYGSMCERAAAEGADLYTNAVDQEFAGLLNHIAGLGLEADGDVIAIKEWERPGTKLTLQSRQLFVD